MTPALATMISIVKRCRRNPSERRCSSGQSHCNKLQNGLRHAFQVADKTGHPPYPFVGHATAANAAISRHSSKSNRSQSACFLCRERESSRCFDGSVELHVLSHTLSSAYLYFRLLAIGLNHGGHHAGYLGHSRGRGLLCRHPGRWHVGKDNCVISR